MTAWPLCSSCSVACYKKHQELTCSKTAGAAAAAASAAAGAAPVAAAPAEQSATAAAAVPAAAAPAVPAVPKSSCERVAPEDLERLASNPGVLGALGSAELQAILRRIDGGDVATGAASAAATGSGTHNPSDEQRVAALEKYRKANPDFEVFVQQILGVINQD